MWATDDGIGVGLAFPSDVLVPLADIRSVEIETVAVPKSKVPAAIAFGVVGAMTARSSRDKVAITVTLHSGDVGYFQLDVLELPFVQSIFGPWTRERGFDIGPTATGGDLPSQLERVARLHQSGALTDDEFAVAKARLLAGG